MTPKEKAKYLISINTLAILSVVGNKLTMDEAKDIAIQCTIIAVDEIMEEYSVLQIETSFCYKQFLYWKEVKEELEQSK